MATRYSFSPDIRFDRRARQWSNQQGCPSLRVGWYILFQVFLVLSTRFAGAASPLTGDQDKEKQSSFAADRDVATIVGDQSSGPVGNPEIFEEASKARSGETQGNSHSAQGASSIVRRLQGFESGELLRGGNSPAQFEPRTPLQPTHPWQTPSGIPANTRVRNVLAERGAGPFQSAYRGSGGDGRPVEKNPVKAPERKGVFLHLKKGREAGRPVLVALQTGKISKHPLRTVEPSLYVQAVHRGNTDRQLRNLPPVHGKISLMAAALLFLLGWISLPWALSLAGLGVFKIVRSQAKREKALIEALQQAEERRGDYNFLMVE